MAYCQAEDTAVHSADRRVQQAILQKGGYNRAFSRKKDTAGQLQKEGYSRPYYR
jgi:hypothetical protein